MAEQFLKDGKAFEPAKFTNLQAGTEGFENFLTEQGATRAPEIATPPVVKPEVVNKAGLLGNVQSTFDKFGGEAGANAAAIRGMARLAGRQATEEELAQGGTLAQTAERFGISDQLKGFGMEKVDEVVAKAEVVEQAAEVAKPKTAAEKISNLFSEFGSQKVGAEATARQGAGIEQKSKNLVIAQENANSARLALENLGILQLKEAITFQDKLAEQKLGKAVTLRSMNAEINDKLSDMSDEQKLDAMILQNNYNASLVSQQIAQGSYNDAKEMVQETADTLKSNFEFQLAALEAQNVIDTQEADLLRQDNNTEYERAKEGFVLLNNAEAAEIEEDKKVTVGGKTYLKPVAPVAKGDFQFVTGTKTQKAGMFDKNTGKFTPLSNVGFIGAGGSSDVIASGMGMDDNGNPIEIDGEVASYLKLVNEGKITPKIAMDEISAAKKSLLVNQLSNTQNAGDTSNDLVAKEKAQLAMSLKLHDGLDSSVGPTRFQRIAIKDLGGARSDFIAGVERLTSGLSLDALIEAKSRGATFGALSEKEMQILSSAATKIGTWRKTNDDGKVVGYEIDEKRFKGELDNINKIISRNIKSSIESQDTSVSDPLGLNVQQDIANSTNPLGI